MKVRSPGETLLVKGEGMPVWKEAGKKGDLYILFEIEMPSPEWLKGIDTAVRSIVLDVEFPFVDIGFCGPNRRLRNYCLPRRQNLHPNRK
jgi:DnaJ-class molecular chaperone